MLWNAYDNIATRVKQFREAIVEDSVEAQEALYMPFRASSSTSETSQSHHTGFGSWESRGEVEFPFNSETHDLGHLTDADGASHLSKSGYSPQKEKKDEEPPSLIVPPQPFPLGDYMPDLTEESSILRQEDVLALASTVPVRHRWRRWRLVYSTGRDGISLATLYRYATPLAQKQQDPFLPGSMTLAFELVCRLLTESFICDDGGISIVEVQGFMRGPGTCRVGIVARTPLVSLYLSNVTGWSSVRWTKTLSFNKSTVQICAGHPCFVCCALHVSACDVNAGEQLKWGHVYWSSETTVTMSSDASHLKPGEWRRGTTAPGSLLSSSCRCRFPSCLSCPCLEGTTRGCPFLCALGEGFGWIFMVFVLLLTQMFILCSEFSVLCMSSALGTFCEIKGPQHASLNWGLFVHMDIHLCASALVW